MEVLPTLYSFRRCPYAIRARMAIARAGVTVELREVALKDKPEALVAASAKATVPVLIQSNGTVLDESLEIMQWALGQHDPDNWLKDDHDTIGIWLQRNDGDFKHWLDRYKYADRFPEQPPETYRNHCEAFLEALEEPLAKSGWLGGRAANLADVAIFPFIRQFAGVDPNWFAGAPYPALRDWLGYWLGSDLFLDVMTKNAVWEPGAPPQQFPLSNRPSA